MIRIEPREPHASAGDTLAYFLRTLFLSKACLRDDGGLCAVKISRHRRFNLACTATALATWDRLVGLCTSMIATFSRALSVAIPVRHKGTE
jgi:hypothetical protein